MRASCLLLLASLAFGCSSTLEPPDGATRSDAGVDAFSGSLDASADTATPDSGTTDASVGVDANIATDGGALTDANAPDGGPCMAAGACNPFDATSCGAMACRPTATGTMCQAVSSTTVGLGMPCLHPADCEPGLVCLTFTPTEGALCHRMCPAHSVGACDTGYVCNGTFGDTCIDVCRPMPAPCDIYAQDCAQPTDTCTLVRNAETGDPYTGCRPAGTQDEGMPCGGASGTCAHALICVATAGVATCRQVCDPTHTPTPCTGADTCSGLATTWGVHYCQAP